MIRGVLFGVLATVAAASSAAEVRVAVAANFAPTCRELATGFREATGHDAILVVGSTGKLYAQIRNGAPFDVFLAADRRRPELLEREGHAVPGSRFTYARGRLVLWSPEPGRVDPEGAILAAGDYRFLAIANPELAPYGVAARQALEARGLWNELSRKLVRGESVGQAFQFVASGNAELGLVAYSQILATDRAGAGSHWLVPETLYRPIEQQAVLLSAGESARAFLDHLRGDDARRTLARHGYEAP